MRTVGDSQSSPITWARLCVFLQLGDRRDRGLQVALAALGDFVFGPGLPPLFARAFTKLVIQDRLSEPDHSKELTRVVWAVRPGRPPRSRHDPWIDEDRALVESSTSSLQGVRKLP